MKMLLGLFRPFRRMSLMVQFSLLLAILVVCMGATAVMASRALVEAQARNQARVVADMAESLGNWVHKYREVWVRTDAQMSDVAAGSAIDRRHYAASEHDVSGLAGMRQSGGVGQMAAASRIEGYHSKNSDVVRREVADMLATSASIARFKATAPSVINVANAPSDFDQRAMTEIALSGVSEYWAVENGQLFFARRLMASESCLACHGASSRAPSSIRAQFPGAQGYGYQPGKMAGVLSVAVLMPSTLEVLVSSLSVPGWVAIAGVVLAVLAVVRFVLASVIAPVNRLRDVAEAMAGQNLDRDFSMPKFRREQMDSKSSNEADRLAQAVVRLGNALRFAAKERRGGEY